MTEATTAVEPKTVPLYRCPKGHECKDFTGIKSPERPDLAGEYCSICYLEFLASNLSRVLRVDELAVPFSPRAFHLVEKMMEGATPIFPRPLDRVRTWLAWKREQTRATIRHWLHVDRDLAWTGEMLEGIRRDLNPTERKAADTENLLVLAVRQMNLLTETIGFWERNVPSLGRATKALKAARKRAKDAQAVAAAENGEGSETEGSDDA